MTPLPSNQTPWRHGVVACLLPPLLALAGCSPPAPEPVSSARPVKTLLVTAGDETRTRFFPGKAEAAKRVELAFQVGGLLIDLPIREGQEVKAGEVIAQLRKDEFEARLTTLLGQLDQARAALTAARAGERPEQILRLESQLRAAEARLTNARSELERASQLVRTNTVSRESFERTQTTYRVAVEERDAAAQLLEKGTVGREEDIDAREAEVRGLEGRVVEANIQLADTTLLAPYDGVIAQRFVEVNQNISPAQPVVKFQDVDEIEVAVDVPEAVMAADLRSADIISIVAEFSGAPGLQFPAHISEIAQRADPVTQTFLVRVALKAPEDVAILPGMTATVTVTYRRASVLDHRILVPITAIAKLANGEQVAWVIATDGTVAARPARLGEVTGGQVEILEGLSPGDRIATAGVSFLREGMKVRDLGDALGGQP